MTNQTCRCGQGKTSAYDGKCGYCRTKRERLAHKRMLEGWPRDEAERGYRNRGDLRALRAFGQKKAPDS